MYDTQTFTLYADTTLKVAAVDSTDGAQIVKAKALFVSFM
jgi:hypothetical protein